MRGIATVLLVAFFMVAYMVAAPAAVEGVGEFVKDQPVLEQSDIDVIDSMYDSLFMWIPLVVLFGMPVWAIVWYIRKQVIIGRV